MLKKKIVVALAAAFIPLCSWAAGDAASFRVPPKPVENPALDAMVGNWAADSEMMGSKMHDKLSVKWGVNHQFLIFELKAVGADSPQTQYEGMGVFGVNPKGQLKTWWFDSWGADSVSTGTGTVSGNKVDITDGNRVFKETRSFEMKDGQLHMKAKGEMTHNGKKMPFDQTVVYHKE